MLIQVNRVRKSYVYAHGVRLETGDSSSYCWGRVNHSMHFDDFVCRHKGDPANNCYWENQIFSKEFLIKLLDIYYDVTGYSDTVICVCEDTIDYNHAYRITLSGEGTDISQMIDYLREKYATFYTPDRKRSCYIDYHSLAKQRREAAKGRNDILQLGVPFKCLTETQRLQKENKELKEEIGILRDLINKIHEDSDI